MMVGEIDYDDHFVDKNGKQNENTMAPCVPTPEFSAIIVFFFCMMVSVLLMNFLVSYLDIVNFTSLKSGLFQLLSLI